MSEETDQEPERGPASGPAEGADPDPATPDGFPADDERLWAMGAHLSGALFSFVGPLAVRLLKPDGSPYLRENVRASLNFQVVVFLAWVVTWLIYWLPCPNCLGWIGNVLVLFANAALVTIAGIQAYDGKRPRYPIDVRWID